MSRAVYIDSYQRRRLARHDLRLTDPRRAQELDGEDRAYFRHTYLKRAERRLREVMAAMASNKRLPDVVRAYVAHLQAKDSTERIQLRFLQAIQAMEVGDGDEEREGEVEDMFFGAEESSLGTGTQ